MTDKIIPTPGRIVHYYPGVADGLAQFGKGTSEAQPLAAIVAGVHADNMVNLCVFDSYGNPHARPNVYLVQPGLATPDHAHCEWMPYQVKAAGIELPVVEAPAPASDTPDEKVEDHGYSIGENGQQVPNGPAESVQTEGDSVTAQATQ